MRKRREPDFTTYILGDPNMNPLDLFNLSRHNMVKKNFKNYNIIQYKVENYTGMLASTVKEMIEKKDFDAAKKFVDDNKDNLGDYLEQAKGLVSGNEMVSGALDKIKGLF